MPPMDLRAREHAERDALTDSLFTRLRSTDPDTPDSARLVSQIFELYEDLCQSLARRYTGRGVDREDLVQVASLALVKAIHRYRPGTGTTFAGYAVPTVTGELKRHFRDHAWVVRPTRRIQELHLTLRRRREAVTHELARTPTRSELADALSVDLSELAQAEGADSGYRPLSIDATTSTGSSGPLAETVGDDGPLVEQVCDHVDLVRALEELPVSTRQLLHLRFVEELTQREIAQRIGTSQMQVSRLIGRATARLRRRLAVQDHLPEGLAS